MPKPTIDPWLEDDGFSRVDFGMSVKDLRDPDAVEDPVTLPEIEQPNSELQPELVVDPAAVEPPAAEPEGPETIEIPGEGTVTLRKTSKGWEAELRNLSGGQPQVYKGSNKNELLANALKAQLNATKKIRDLNRENRSLKQTPTPPPQPAPTATPSVRALSADEIVDIKLKLETNPDLAFEELFQKKTGLSFEQLAQIAQDAREGKQAKLELLTEQVGKAFVEANPDYYPTPQNFEKIIKYLAKYKLGYGHVRDEQAVQVMHELAAKGFYTVESLEEAFEELSEDGSLQTKPAPPQPQAPPEPASRTTTTGERIVRQETRPRASFGLRTSGNPLPPASNELSAEETRKRFLADAENMSDEQIASLMISVRKQQLASRRN